MLYAAEISRSNPTCFLFVLDQSGSMLDVFGGDPETTSVRKADYLADVVNRTIYELIMRCTKPEEVRNYYDISIIGYGDSVAPLLGAGLSSKDFISISELANNPIRIEAKTKKVPDGAGGLVEQQIKFPIWIDPKGSNGTPMCKALSLVYQFVEKWISDPRHKTSYPPTILHITDGESTDGDPTEIGKRILSLSTADGQVLFYNCHLSSERSQKILYPNNSEILPNQYARLLYDLSSILPPSFIEVGKQIGIQIQSGSKGFIFNSDAISLVQFFDIGTRPANLR